MIIVLLNDLLSISGSASSSQGKASDVIKVENNAQHSTLPPSRDTGNKDVEQLLLNNLDEFVERSSSTEERNPVNKLVQVFEAKALAESQNLW